MVAPPVLCVGRSQIQDEAGVVQVQGRSRGLPLVAVEEEAVAVAGELHCPVFSVHVNDTNVFVDFCFSLLFLLLGDIPRR